MSLDVAALFEEHHERLYRYLFRLAGDEEVARDAVQHAFVRMLESPPDPAEPKAWLYRVATNAVFEWGRTSRRRAEIVETRADPPGLGDAPEDPLEATERREAARRLRAALAPLSERDRTLLLMRGEGFSHREMAEAVGTSTGSVGTMIARALRKAAAALQEEKRG